MLKAPLERRIVSFIIDCAVSAALLGGFSSAAYAISAALDDALGWLIALILALCGIIGFVAYVLFRDAFFGGMGCGKKVMKLRVVESDGARCRWESSALRNVTMIVPLLNVLELVLAVFDTQGLRLGDRIARTQVVE